MRALACSTMRPGASTPEALDALLEDGLLLRDGSALAALFEPDAVICTAGSDRRWRYAVALLVATDNEVEEATMTDEMANAVAPMVVAEGEGEARWWLGQLAEIKATADDTAGQLTVIEITCPGGLQSPLHVHHVEDEAFWMLAGDATLEVGGRTIPLRAGGFAFGPRGIPHRYTVGADGCRMLFLLTPGGLEALVREMSEPAGARELPPPPARPPDLDWVREIARRHNCDLLV